MTSFKLTFRFERQNQNRDARLVDDNQYKLKLHTLLDGLSITRTRMYTPSLHSIKVLFPTEAELNKVLDNKAFFEQNSFQPHISMAIKASRTIFCSNLDAGLVQTFSPNDMKEHLQSKGWNAMGVYVMKSKTALKIEMDTKLTATKFLANINTDNGGVKITNEQKEREIDPTVNQCWTCGVLNPTHSSTLCQGNKACLKCGDPGHQFFTCALPRLLTDMNIYQRSARYCNPCGRRGDHTSLDHSFCPEKRKIVNERI